MEVEGTATTPTTAFGLIVPGGPVRQDFVAVDETHQKFALELNLEGSSMLEVGAIHELVVFLGAAAANELKASGKGCLVYWRIACEVPGGTMSGRPPLLSGFELLGSLSPDRPSAVFRTGWSEHDTILSIPPTARPLGITIGLSLEPMDAVHNLTGDSVGAAATAAAGGGGGLATHTTSHAIATSRRPLVAQKIAQDLFNYMESFDTGAHGGGQMLVPKNIFERWWKRFEQKSQRDPNFFLKSG